MTVLGFTLAGLLALAPAPANAVTLYVDGGSVGGVCSDAYPVELNAMSRPWCSVKRGLRAAPSGSRLEVRGGTYPPTSVAGVSRADYLTVAAHGSERPVIGGLDLRNSDRLRFENVDFAGGVRAVGSEDLQFAGGEVALRPDGPATGSGFILRGCARVRIENMFVHDGRDGVALVTASPPSTDVMIAANRFVRMGADGVHIASGSQRVTVTDNVFRAVHPRGDVDPEAHADAVQVEGPTTGVQVLANEVYDGRGFLFMVPPGDAGERGVGNLQPVIANNVLRGPQFGIRVLNVVGARIVHNTVWGTSSGRGTGVDIRDQAGLLPKTAETVLAGNIIKRLDVGPAVGFRARARNLVSSRRFAGPADLRGPVRFVALPRGDVRLRRQSAAVDAGARAWAPVLDAAGRLREARPDIGAYEYVGAG